MAEPVRRCAGCGRKTGKSELTRVIRLQSGEVVFDPDGTRQGRSLYFCPKLECFETLMRRGAPQKLMKASVPEEVQEAITSYLSRAERGL